MKAETILAAITALRQCENMAYSETPRNFGRIVTDALYARADLEAELTRELPDVKVERESQQ